MGVMRQAATRQDFEASCRLLANWYQETGYNPTTNQGDPAKNQQAVRFNQIAEQVRSWSERKKHLSENRDNLLIQPPSCFEKIKRVFLAFLSLLLLSRYHFQTFQQRSDSSNQARLAELEDDVNRWRATIQELVKDFQGNEGEQFLGYLGRHQAPTLQERLRLIGLSPIRGLVFVGPEMIQDYRNTFGAVEERAPRA